MKITKISNNIQPGFKSNTKTSPDKQKNQLPNNNNLLWLGGGIAAAAGIYFLLRGKKPVNSDEVIQNVKPNITRYQECLASGLSRWTGENIDPAQLKSVISGKELLEECKSLNPENYVFSKENINSGKFLADLHSHSIFSDGNADIPTILTEVANHADKTYQKTGKKFIYALTDHDTDEGVKQALKYISENSQKFKNVKFVVGSELSFVHPAEKNSQKVDVSEILVYGFDPFDKDVENFFVNLKNTREKYIKEYIEEMNRMFSYADFSYEEFNKFYSHNPKSANHIMTYAWKAHDYCQTKNAVAGYAGELGKDKAAFYNEIMTKAGDKKALFQLREQNLVPQSYGEDSRITDICKDKYISHLKDGKIVPIGQNHIEDICKIFGKGEDTFFAFAHPYYLSEKTSTPMNVIDDVIKKSNGYLKGTESYHQAYKKVNPEDVKVFNKKLMDKYPALVQLGGRDNHEKHWMN